MDGIAVTDIVVLIITVLSALLAFARGFAKEVLSLLGWVGAVVITVFLFPYVEPYLQDWIGNKWLARIATGIGVFILAMIVLSIFSNFISETIQDSSMSGVDRGLGILFGVFRAWVVLAVFFIAIERFYEKREQVPKDIREAKSAPAIIMGADILWSLLPDRLRSGAGEAAKSVKGTTKSDLLKKGIDTLGNSKSNQKDFEKLLNPRPSGDSKQKESGGYEKKDRKNLDDLMERTVQ